MNEKQVLSKTPSLSLRLRFPDTPRLAPVFGSCSVSVRMSFGSCSDSVQLPRYSCPRPSIAVETA